MEVKPTTLREYATRMDIKKSKLHWYCELGLLKPTGKIGSTFYFDEEYLTGHMKRITDYQKDGKTLKEIGDIFNSETQ